MNLKISLRLGAIADDLTGATDLCLMLSREGMRVVQVIGVAEEGFEFGDAEAVVIALKSRTIPAQEAVSQSLAAANCLLSAGAQQLFFKYCSTFDSTADGNIGPVIAALLERLGAPISIACPAFPENGRTVYQGHLFVGDQLLSDSPMKDHPLTPMRDANLVRVLGAQTSLPVGLVARSTVAKGADAIRDALNEAANGERQILIVDAIANEDLRAIGHAARDLKLVTGGSGIAIGLPANFGITPRSEGKAQAFSAPLGKSVILAGSCSAATRRQIAAAQDAGIPTHRIDPLAIAEGRMGAEDMVERLIAEAHPTPLVYSSDDPSEVARVQDHLGRERAGALVEDFLSEVAKDLYRQGVRRLVVAGGETSGAVVAALGVRALSIGPEIDPGVPWTRSLGGEADVALALKSGNFGSDDFFLKAWSLLS